MEKIVLITGCSTGIGEYCASSLHVKNGYKVLATARSEEDVKKLQDKGIWACCLDLDDSSSIDEALEKVLHVSNGKIDVLFNNAAFGQPGAVEDLSRDVLRKQFETNLFGTHELTCKVLKVMRKQGSGRIIQNSSVLGFVAMPFRGAYNASKFALEGLSDTLRQELVGSDIHVSLIEPGPIRSDFRKNALKKFEENIDIKNSFFKKTYEKTLQRLQSTGDSTFTQGSDAVCEVLIKAIEAKEPKPRYRVTIPTKVLWYLKNILSTNVLDNLLIKGGE